MDLTDEQWAVLKAIIPDWLKWTHGEPRCQRFRRGE
jgi:hypothetical protein